MIKADDPDISSNDNKKAPDEVDIKLIVAEEVIFAAIFFIWLYILGFRSEAYGTEKFMDFGFINAMLRSDYMPFSDMWMSGYDVNYYYGGQFIAAFLIRLTGVTAGEGYSLMRALITSASFSLPFSLIAGIAYLRTDGGAGKRRNLAAGALAGLAVAFCGNFHYVIYGLIIPGYYRITGNMDYSYWFPHSTRYIGYDPDLPDKTIHEFPAYSSILGDLHAHYINILFVITVIAVAAAYLANRPAKNTNKTAADIFSPEVILIGFMTGLFRWINYWDLPICFVVCASILFTANLRKRGLAAGAALTVIQGVLIYVIGYASALPFTLLYKNDYMNIGFTHSHTLLYQLVILWGLPAAVCIIFIVLMFAKYKKTIFRTASDAELIIIIFAFCAMGLVLMPELVYVKDIYGEEFYRANTMFKLTYQAFILFGMCMGYILAEGITFDGHRNAGDGGEPENEKDSGVIRFASAAGIFLLILTAGFSITGIYSWFGNVFDISERGTIDAACFLEQDLPGDINAVKYINEEIAGGTPENGMTGDGALPVILEACDSSYGDGGRVSVLTGIPTVLGWHGHEQLWRFDAPAVSERWYDVGNIYSGTDPGEVRKLLEKYGVDYIYVGNVEKERYTVDDSVLKSLGTIVYEDEFTYIIKIG